MPTPKTIGIIQARMGSTRLPGKVLKEVLGRPLIILMLERLKESRFLDELWVATSSEMSDDPLALELEAQGYPVYRGSENDVLDRFYQLAKLRGAEVVVRLTGDCPLLDASLTDAVIGAYLQEYPRYRYCSNCLPATYPDGLSVEVFSFTSLEDLALHSTNPVEREHVTLGIHRYYHGSPAEDILRLQYEADFSHLRWTVDNAEDLVVVKTIFENIYPNKPNFTWLDALSFITRHPEIINLNSHHRRNEKLHADIALGKLAQ